MADLTTQIKRENLVIPAEYFPEFYDGVQRESLFLRLAKNLGTGSRGEIKIPVASGLPTASFLDRADGNGGRKALTSVSYDAKTLEYAILSAIVVVNQEDFADGLKTWDRIIPKITTAFGKAIDKAAFFGEGRPKQWPLDILSSINTAGSLISPSAGDTLYKSLDEAYAKVEESGYDVTAVVGGVGVKSAFRNLLDSQGRPIVGTEFNETPKYFANNGSWDSARAKLIVGDFNQVLYSIREDVTVKVSDEATITDSNGNSINLWQTNKVALLVEMRIGIAVPNPVNEEDDSDSRYPLAAIVGSTGVGTQNITFTVKDATSPTPVALQGAKIVFANGNIYETNASGQVVVKASAGTYPFTVYKKGYNGDVPYAGVATVVSSAVTKNVTLPANS